MRTAKESGITTIWSTLTALLLLAGCATAPYPAPEERPREECWLPPGRPSALLLAVHGLNDHHGAFRTVATHLNRAGVALCSYDQIGFGTTPQRGQWPGIAPLADDLRRRTVEMRHRYPDVPLFVLGESMGAAVTLVAFSDGSSSPDGLVLSAPAVLGRENVGPVRSWLVKTAAAVLPDLTLARPGNMTVTDEAKVRRELARDPLLIKRTRLEVLAGVISLMDAAAGNACHVRLPTLLLYGERDPVVPPESVAHLAGDLAGPVQSYGFDRRHLLLRGQAAEQSARRIVAWVVQHSGQTL